MIGELKPGDASRDLRADLARSAEATDGALWAWDEDDDRDYIKAAREAWPAAIRRALAAEARVKEFEAALWAIADRPYSEDTMRLVALKALGKLVEQYEADLPPAEDKAGEDSAHPGGV